MNEFWDACTTATKAMTWGQDQLDTLTETWVKQARTMRHDGQKVAEVICGHAKTTAEEMRQLTEQGVKSTLSQVPGWDALTMQDIRRQISDLHTKVDNLAAR